MKPSLSYWITYYEDDGKEICSVPVIGWAQPQGIQIDVAATSKSYVETVQRYAGKKYIVEPACVEVPLTKPDEPVILLSETNVEQG